MTGVFHGLTGAAGAGCGPGAGRGLPRGKGPRAGFASSAEIPLFWRLDLDVRAASAAGLDDGCGRDAAAARDADRSLAASALANGVAAVKAVLRDRPDTARGLLERGFARIGAPTAVMGHRPADITRLAGAAALREPGRRDLADQVRRLADEHLAGGTGPARVQWPRPCHRAVRSPPGGEPVPRPARPSPRTPTKITSTQLSRGITCRASD
ncbi:hypothetical protein ACWCPS_07090 [Streptomyces mauvecolor]